MQEIITKIRGLLKWISLSAKTFTADCYLLRFYSQYLYGELSKLFLFILSWDTHGEVDLLLLSTDLLFSIDL